MAFFTLRQPCLNHDRTLTSLGPTAVLVIIMGLWVKAVYNLKLLQSWKNLEQRPAAATRNLLLDYGSQPEICVLFNALRFREISLALGIAGGIILKLLVIFSTGLLILTPMTMTRDSIPVAYPTKFDALSWSTSQDSKLFSNDPGSLATGADFDDVAFTNAIEVYYNTKSSGTSLPAGYSNQAAFTPFEATAPMQENSVMTATVDTFVPTTSCESATVKILFQGCETSEGKLCAQVEVHTPTCHLDNTSITLDGNLASHATRQYVPGMQWVNCSNSLAETDPEASFEASVSDFRWLLTLSDSYFHTLPGVVMEVKAALCDVGYSMSTATLIMTYGTNGSTSESWLGSHDNVSFSNELPGLTNTKLNQAVTHALVTSSDMLPLSSFRVSPTDSSQATIPLFYLMYLAAGPSVLPLASVFDGNSLVQTAQSVFNSISALLAIDQFITSNDKTATGVLTETVKSLQVSLPSLWTMFVYTVSLSIISVTLVIVHRSVNVGPKAPNTIEAIALIEAATSSTIKAIRCDTGSSMMATNPFAHQKKSDYVPLAITYPMLVLVFGFSILTVVALEVLQTMSNKHDDLLAVANITSITYFSWASTLILTIIVALLTGVDYAVSLYTTTAVLEKSSSVASRSLRLDLVYASPIHSLWKALRQKHFGAALMKLVTILGIFLPIVSSGLWSLDYSEPSKQNLVQALNISIPSDIALNADTTLSSFIETGVSSTRAIMDRISSAILEVLLCIIIVCSATAVLLARRQGVLAHNLGSIAGTMSLIIDNGLLDDVAEEGINDQMSGDW
jgi:hypothetical protein